MEQESGVCDVTRINALVSPCDASWYEYTSLAPMPVCSHVIYTTASPRCILSSATTCS